MKSYSCSVLVLAPPADDIQVLENLLSRLQCETVVARSPEQAIAQVHETVPCLVILAGEQSHQTIASKLRNTENSSGATIVALSDFHLPNWDFEDHSGLDGFLVKPMTSDVLTSLVQSAKVRQTCSQAS